MDKVEFYTFLNTFLAGVLVGVNLMQIVYNLYELYNEKKNRKDNDSIEDN